MEECDEYDMNIAYQKRNAVKQYHPLQKNIINSPIFFKKTPKFNNTLKKSIQKSENVPNNLNHTNSDDYFEESSPIKSTSKAPNKDKTINHAKSKSIYIPKDQDEELGFIKNKVEIINSNHKSKKLDITENSEKENSSHRHYVKNSRNFEEKLFLKEVTNKSNMKITFPTTESIILENNNMKFFKSPLKIKDNKENTINKYDENQKTNNNKMHVEPDLNKIFKDLGISLNNPNNKALFKDKSVLNNLNMLCIIQKNLKEIAERKKEYLTDLFMKKSLSIDSNAEMQKFDYDSNSIQQPPIDDFCCKTKNQNKIYGNPKQTRSKSFCSIKKQSQNKENLVLDDKNSNMRNSCYKKLKTIDFEDFFVNESSIKNKKITENIEENYGHESSNSTTELLKLLSIKNTQEQSKKNSSSSFLFQDDTFEDFDENDNIKEESFLREFVINYPLSKKRNMKHH